MSSRIHTLKHWNKLISVFNNNIVYRILEWWFPLMYQAGGFQTTRNYGSKRCYLRYYYVTLFEAVTHLYRWMNTHKKITNLGVDEKETFNPTRSTAAAAFQRLMSLHWDSWSCRYATKKHSNETHLYKFSCILLYTLYKLSGRAANWQKTISCEKSGLTAHICAAASSYS